jgi:hypothetical protein
MIGVGSCPRLVSRFGDLIYISRAFRVNLLLYSMYSCSF